MMSWLQKNLGSLSKLCTSLPLYSLLLLEDKLQEYFDHDYFLGKLF